MMLIDDADIPIIDLDSEVDDVFSFEPAPWIPYDITDEIKARLFPDLSSHVRISHLFLAGMMESGKTTLLIELAQYCVWKYGRENVNIVYTDDMRVAFEEMSDYKPVNLLIVDDATEFASSRDYMKHQAMVSAFYRIRHIAKEKSKNEVGLVCVIFSAQRIKEIDVAFRDAPLGIIKTAMTTAGDMSELKKSIPPQYMDILNQNWNKINQGIDKAKSLSIGYIKPLAGTEEGCGLYRSHLVDFPDFPKMIRSNEYFADKEEEVLEEGVTGNTSENLGDKSEEKVTLEELKESHLYDSEIACYEAVKVEGLSIRKASEKLGIPYSTLRRGIAKIEKLLDVSR